MRPPKKPSAASEASVRVTAAERRWAPLVAEWRSSGLRASEFCRQRNVSEAAFRYWKGEIGRREKRRAKRVRARGVHRPRRTLKFVPVRVVPDGAAPPSPRPPLEIVLAGGRALRVSGDFDPALLSKLIAALEAPR